MIVAGLGGFEAVSAGPDNREAGQSHGHASAEIVVSLTVTRHADLEFGAIASSSQPGTVTVSPVGESVATGGSRIICCMASQAARFSVDGEAGRAYTISIPASVIARGDPVRKSAARPPDLVVNDLKARTESRPDSGASGVLDGAGKDGFSVGGTLHIPGNVPPARYEASVPVTVVYG
ncbi:MAG: DUF4402 domain-containing protein [Novosphingobium sp.]|nr:DUF4402 domain-containing protein [Novosphingobium sp.]